MGAGLTSATRFLIIEPSTLILEERFMAANVRRSRWLFLTVVLAVSVGLVSFTRPQPKTDPWDEAELGCTSIMAGRWPPRTAP